MRTHDKHARSPSTQSSPFHLNIKAQIKNWPISVARRADTGLIYIYLGICARGFTLYPIAIVIVNTKISFFPSIIDLYLLVMSISLTCLKFRRPLVAVRSVCHSFEPHSIAVRSKMLPAYPLKLQFSFGSCHHAIFGSHCSSPCSSDGDS